MPVWAIGFALEQPLHVVALACSASGILKQLGYKASVYAGGLVFFLSFFAGAFVSAQEFPRFNRNDGAPRAGFGERSRGGERNWQPNGENRPPQMPNGIRPNRPNGETRTGVIDVTSTVGNNAERNDRGVQRLREFDTNKNGMLEQNEISDPQRRENINRIVTRLGGDPNQIPININELAKRATSNSGAVSPSGNLPTEPLVPYFGEDELTRTAILRFGERNIAPTQPTTNNITNPPADKLSEVKAIMSKFDTNRNGTLDKDKGEWNGLSVDGNNADQNKDGRISMNELMTALGGVPSGVPAFVKVKPSIPYEHLPTGVPSWFFDRDLDRDAQLTLLEFANGHNLNDSIAAEFLFLDKNNDGFATIAEIFQALRQHDEENQKREELARRERELRLGNTGNGSSVAVNEIDVNNPNTTPPTFVNTTNGNVVIMNENATTPDNAIPPNPLSSEGEAQKTTTPETQSPFVLPTAPAPTTPFGESGYPEPKPVFNNPTPYPYPAPQPNSPPNSNNNSNTGSWTPGMPTTQSNSFGNNNRAGNSQRDNRRNGRGDFRIRDRSRNSNRDTP
ncbi:MAG: hypothetical protein LBJ00_12550 [Planctomycetaceae bacterium]|nr:hypothetical protein [Planctomycetaceae bacterium]